MADATAAVLRGIYGFEPQVERQTDGDSGFSESDIFGGGGDETKWQFIRSGPLAGFAFNPETGELKPAHLVVQEEVPAGIRKLDRLLRRFGIEFPIPERVPVRVPALALLGDEEDAASRARARQDAFERAADLYSLIFAARQQAQQERQNLVDTLLNAAPALAGGQSFYGGFGPYGGGTLLELLHGGPGAARPLSVLPVPVDTPADIAARQRANESLIEQLLRPLL